MEPTANREASSPGSSKRTVTANVSGLVRRVVENGREFLVAPMTLLKEGVLSGSKGSLFYPSDEIEVNASQWNDVPILLGHPEIDGKHVSAKHPDVYGKWGMGFLRNAKAGDGKLKSEGWFDAELTKRVSPDVFQRLSANRPIDLSTGLFTENEPAFNGAEHNGRPYTHVARNYKADHLAILPNQRGACILPGQRIEGRFINGSKVWYAGEAVRLMTASGEVLSVTANHPVLTGEGFTPAGQITEGQDLLHYIGEDESFSTNSDEKDAPALVEDVFDALKRVCPIQESRSTSALDFHGDAAFFKSDVEIVRSECSLPLDVVSETSQRLSQSCLRGMGHAQAGLSGCCHTHQLIGLVDPPDVSQVGRGGKPFALLETEMGVHQSRGFGAVADNPLLTQPSVDDTDWNARPCADLDGTFSGNVGGDSSIGDVRGKDHLGNPVFSPLCIVGPGAELDIPLPKFASYRADVDTTGFGDVLDGAPGFVIRDPIIDHPVGNDRLLEGTSDWDTLAAQSVADRRNAEIELFRQLPKAFPGKVLADKVIGVDRFFHDGPVYDFETTTGYIIAEKLIVSNCSVSDGCGVLINKEDSMESTENKYNASQPRDSQGRWGSGGGGGGGGPMSDKHDGPGGQPPSAEVKGSPETVERLKKIMFERTKFSLGDPKSVEVTKTFDGYKESSAKGDTFYDKKGNITKVVPNSHSLMKNQEGGVSDPPIHSERRSNMTDTERKAIVDSLITNCDCGWSEDDRPLLNSMNEEQLSRLNEQADSIGDILLVANAATEGFQDERGNSHRFNPEKNRWESVLNAMPAFIKEKIAAADAEDEEESEDEEETTSKKKEKPVENMTQEQWLAAAPPEMLAVFNYGSEQLKKEHDALIKTITANERNLYSVGELEAIANSREGIKHLRKLAALAHVEPKKEEPVANSLPIWMGAATPANAQEPTFNKNASWDIDEVDWAEIAAQGRG